VRARAPEQRQAVLEQRLPLTSRDTPATVMGPWPERALTAISAITVILALRFRYRRPARRQESHAPATELTRSTQQA
jgi:apolipoprotein N-acyltransferase